MTRGLMALGETYVQSDGARIWTVAQGQGVPVMLCNGGPGCCDYLGPVAGMIDDIACVLRFEQRGCGRSDAKRPYNLETCVSDLDIIRRHYGVAEWIIGGHSWGSDLAVAYALEHPEHVLGILGISGGVIHKDSAWREQYRRGKASEVNPGFQFPSDTDVNPEVNESWKEFVRRPDLLRRIAGLTVPALFVYGENDIRPSWPVEQLAQLLPYGQFVLISGAAHVIWLTHANALQNQLRDFVVRVAEQWDVKYRSRCVTGDEAPFLG
ncbi:MAG: alpha/beta hydrolase [Candidatus Hydrogenedentes bacterium]|nr:alpha/beta hydrolase [Candidatus Hydrogenedentota bacterium]